MPAPLVRKAIWALVAGGVAFALLLVSLPFIASTQIVRTRIAQELSLRTGYRVTLEEAPDLVLWPSFKAVLNQVSFTRWDAPDMQAVLETERLEAGLSAWQAIAGRIDFSTVTLVRPTVRVNAAGSRFALPHLPRDSPLLALLRAADAGEKVEGAGFGTVRFAQGRLIEEATGEDVATDLTGLAEWRTMAAPALVNGTGVWRGETIKYAAMVETPMGLAARQQSKVSLSLESDPVRISFSGSIDRHEGIAYEGVFEASSPSPRRALEWAGAEISAGAAMGPLALSGNATGEGMRMKLADARLSLDGNPGAGALEVDFAGGVPQVSGTLAFDTIDFGNFLAAFVAPGGASAPAPVFDLAFSDQVVLDLRLSAARAKGAGVELVDVAATAQVQSGFAAFDISDATAFGGEIQAGFRVDRKPEGEAGEMRISAEGIDWAEVSRRFGWKGDEMQSRGMLNLVLRSPITVAGSLARSFSGTVNARFGAGSLRDFDLAKLLAQEPGTGFFTLDAITGSPLAFEGAEFKAALDNGVARIETARVWTAAEDIRIEGIVPYVGRSLALSLSVDKRQPAGTVATPHDAVAYFVGGSWDAPYITALLTAVEP